MIPVFATAYFPPIGYLRNVLAFDSIKIECHENFVKQSFRNRCCILNSNGVQTLSIPLIQAHEKIKSADVEISFAQNWKLNHWRSIESAYNRSAYFEFYKDELKDLFFLPEKNLIHFNTKLLNWLLLQIKSKAIIGFTDSFQKMHEKDFRSLCDSGKNTAAITSLLTKEYPQVFSYKYDFTPNLSMLDLLFNCGPDARMFL